MNAEVPYMVMSHHSRSLDISLVYVHACSQACIIQGII